MQCMICYIPGSICYGSEDFLSNIWKKKSKNGYLIQDETGTKVFWVGFFLKEDVNIYSLVSTSLTPFRGGDDGRLCHRLSVSWVSIQSWTPATAIDRLSFQTFLLTHFCYDALDSTKVTVLNALGNSEYYVTSQCINRETYVSNVSVPITNSYLSFILVIERLV